MDSHVDNPPTYVPVDAPKDVFNLQKAARNLREEATEEMVEQDLRVQEARQREIMMEQADASPQEYVVDDAHLSKSATQESLSYEPTADNSHSLATEAMQHEQELEHLEVDERPSEEYSQSQHQDAYSYESGGEQPTTVAEQQEPQQAEAAFEPAVKQIEILPLLDITGELRFVKERQTFLAKEGRPHGDVEWVALQELEQSTLALVSSRKSLSERQRQLAQLDTGDKRSAAMQSEVYQLTAESKQKEHEWSVIKEAYYHDFVIAAIKAAAAQAAEAHEALKEMISNIQQLLVISLLSATAIMAQGIPPPGSLTVMVPASPTPFPTLVGHPHRPSRHPHHDLPNDMERGMYQGDWNPDNDADHGGQGQGPLQLVCPSAGFFCESTLIDYTRSRMSMPAPMVTSKPLVDSSARTALVGVFGGIGGGQGGGSQKASDYFVCSAGNRQMDYCVGGGPATVPKTLESGDGLYCGETIRRGLGLDQDDNSDVHDQDSGEYLRNNLYYFVGSHGVNLGPCPGRCVSAGAGVSDYCQA
ncbi:hypothetical protein EMPS_03641 [Entomortierella parvispora]|uniref:Uncharacterized protein n=1 Tax=Entomortierella parvispora TaxID=205924 RepID=A0A9P3LUL8_9FUNG|nr:hypothetical protein EMPS_03641 [Entomortierella parvispora]